MIRWVSYDTFTNTCLSKNKNKNKKFPSLDFLKIFWHLCLTVYPFNSLSKSSSRYLHSHSLSSINGLDSTQVFLIPTPSKFHVNQTSCLTHTNTMTGFCKTSLALAVLFLGSLVCEARVIPSHSEFVKTRETEFILNGSPFLFNGFNSYWMMHVAAQPSERYKISNAFREAADSGLRVCRTWAFSDGGDQALQISPGVYNEAVFQVNFLLSINV